MDIDLPADLPNEIKEFWEKRGYKLSADKPDFFSVIIFGTRRHSDTNTYSLITVAIYDEEGKSYFFGDLISYSEEEALTIIRNYAAYI